METLTIQKNKNRTYPQDAVLCLENHLGQRGHQCSVEGCRDVWFYGDGDVRHFDGVDTVCATHGYLIPRMSVEELEEKEIGTWSVLIYNANGESRENSEWVKIKKDYHINYVWSIWRNNRYEVDMFPTIVYTSKGRRKEFISEEGQKRRNELDEFFRSRRK